MENIGKGLALHPAPFVMGLFDEEIHGNRGIPMSYTCLDFGVTNCVEKVYYMDLKIISMLTTVSLEKMFQFKIISFYFITK
jgi:hypothetical protein